MKTILSFIVLSIALYVGLGNMSCTKQAAGKKQVTTPPAVVPVVAVQPASPGGCVCLQNGKCACKDGRCADPKCPTYDWNDWVKPISYSTGVYRWERPKLSESWRWVWHGNLRKSASGQIIYGSGAACGPRGCG